MKREKRLGAWLVGGLLGVLVAAFLGGAFGYWWRQSQDQSFTPSIYKEGDLSTDAVDAFEAATEGPVRVVLWISIDGFRGDYVERYSLPFVKQLQAESLWTKSLISTYPAITFPSHVGMATGTNVEKHGIPLNRFYDRETQNYFSYPSDSSLLEAEPIWTLASRAGLRVAVKDWVLSHRQTGPDRAAYFNDSYNPRLSDRERLWQILNVYREDESASDLRLLMGYMEGPDSVGHRYGPDSPELKKKLQEVDELLKEFFEEFLSLWNEKQDKEDELIVILSTDHGMTSVDYTVDVEELTGLRERFDIPMPIGANIAHLFVDQVSHEEREALIEQVKQRLQAYPFAQLIPAKEFQERTAYGHPTRVGDYLIVLDKGYAFSRSNEEPREVVTPVTKSSSLQGVHAYDPEDPEMRGFSLFWRYPDKLKGKELGELRAIQYHATVAHLLGFMPSSEAEPEPLWIPPLLGEEME